MNDRPLTGLNGKIHVKHGFPFKGEHFKPTGTYVVLTPGNFFEQGGFKRNAGKDKCYSEPFPEEYLLRKGDIVVAMTEQSDGLLGSMAKIPEDSRFLHNQRLGLVTSLTDEVNVEFLYHLFKTRSVRQQLRNSASGSKVKHTSPERIYDVQVPLPEPMEQAAIAKLLTLIDDQIDINNHVNDELEGMAKLLYDYWFEQFDFPITAAQAAAMGKPRLEGKPYRASGGKMVFSDTFNRDIPEGWLPGAVEDLFVFNPSESLRDGTDGPYFDMDAVPTSGFMTKKAQTKVFRGGTKFRNGDVVVARITPCLENGKTALITLLKHEELGFGSTEFIVMRGKPRSLSAFGACLARSGHYRSFAIRNMTGTSGRKRIEGSVLKTFPLPIPPLELLSSFEEICSPMFQLMTDQERQNHELVELRDWLLPMLMNGQVTVS